MNALKTEIWADFQFVSYSQKKERKKTQFGTLKSVQVVIYFVRWDFFLAKVEGKKSEGNKKLYFRCKNDEDLGSYVCSMCTWV